MPFDESARLKDTTALDKALRDTAQAMINSDAPPAREDITDLAELLKVLARMVAGKSVYQAFGAPGSWGYGTPIGDALRTAYNSGNLSTKATNEHE